MPSLRIFRTFTLGFLASILIVGCGGGLGPVDEILELPRALSLAETELIDASSGFSFDFLARTMASNPEDNLFLSPLSASMALGMTLNGAAEGTFDEMQSMLGFGSLTLDEINQGYRDLLSLLSDLDPRVELTIGNSIWYADNFSVRTEFLNRTIDFFDAQIQELDFSDSATPGVINDWVRASTKGKIKEIVDSPLDPNTVMFLINAVYFNSKWTHRFDKGKTFQAPFHAGDGSTPSVPLMEVEETFLHTETDDYQIVSLPYSGGAFEMTILLPEEGVSLESVVDGLTGPSWRGLMAGMTPEDGTVYLPRFRMSWEKLLNETLKAMGMEEAFVPGVADFHNLSPDARALGLYVSRVKQKSWVDVDEDGTEAAGATSVEVSLTSMPTHFELRADHPFLFVIQERLSGTILFTGVYNEPPED